MRPTRQPLLQYCVLTPHVAEHFEEITQSVILVFRKDTGHLRYIFSSFHSGCQSVASDFIAYAFYHDTMATALTMR